MSNRPSRAASHCHLTAEHPGATTLPLGWEAEYHDPTGLDQLQARYLDPTTATFTQTDPLSAPDPQPAPSPYLYANNQPTTYVDPTGQRCSEADYQIAGYLTYAKYEVNPLAGSGLFGSSSAYESGAESGLDIATGFSAGLNTGSTVLGGALAIKDFNDISKQYGVVQTDANRDLNR